MLSSEAKQVLRRQLRALSERVRLSGRDHRQEARRVFRDLQLEDGPIRSLTPLGYAHADVLSLAVTADDDPALTPLYAVDGGSTRVKRLEDGTTLCVYQAVLAADPDTRFQGMPLEAHRSLTLVSHAHRLDIGGAQAELVREGYVHLRRVHLTRHDLDRDVEAVVSGLARVGAEAYHALRMLELLEPSQGVWLLDGPLYPVFLYYYFAGSPTVRGLSWADWEPVVEILGGPLRLVEQCAERGIPLLGLNKTPGGAWLLEFAAPSEERSWASDAQFIKAVLRKTPRDALGYTSWFVQEGYALPPERESFDLFERLRERLALKLPPRAYHVCFFFVYDPRVQAVLKVEAPRALVEAHTPERLQRKVLGEIARGKGVPPAIRRADSRARITEEESFYLLRDCLRDCGLEIDWLYDQSRYSDF